MAVSKQFPIIYFLERLSRLQGCRQTFQVVHCLATSGDRRHREHLSELHRAEQEHGWKRGCNFFQPVPYRSRHAEMSAPNRLHASPAHQLVHRTNQRFVELTRFGHIGCCDKKQVGLNNNIAIIKRDCQRKVKT